MTALLLIISLNSAKEAAKMRELAGTDKVLSKVAGGKEADRQIFSADSGDRAVNFCKMNFLTVEVALSAQSSSR